MLRGVTKLGQKRLETWEDCFIRICLGLCLLVVEFCGLSELLKIQIIVKICQMLSAHQGSLSGYTYWTPKLVWIIC